jgi:predicted enzyme related to lactoylglutathione lyase
MVREPHHERDCLIRNSSTCRFALSKGSERSLAFDDGVGEVSGTWVLGRPPSSQPGLLLYIMVRSVAATLNAAVANGDEVVQPTGADAPEITARLRDPAGNVIGLYQRPRGSLPASRRSLNNVRALTALHDPA